ncbi:MAG: patatin-like phospholipase family protein [Candidatus Sumerlaeaceae bacterium]
MRRSWRLLLCSLAALTLTGCVLLGDKLDQFRWHFLTLPIYVFDNSAGYTCPPQPEVMEHGTNFAVAVSGGGTRSAVFAAGVLEQLAHLPDPRHPGRSLMDNCDAISGVSGGSLAAAYYSLFKPNDFSSEEEMCAFFQRFKSNMTVDFEFRGVAHYLTAPWEAVAKYYSRYRFVQTLGNAFDQHIFQGSDFDHLLERELRGEAPVTILNATSLDTGQKFLFTNLNVQQSFTVNPMQLIGSLPSIAPKSDQSALTALAQIASTPIFTPFGFDAINSDIGRFKIAHAVAASSAYPLIPGPAALQNYATPGYVHLADGGVNDNSGVDSIVGLYLGHLQQASAAKRLVVVSINVGAPLKEKKSGNPDGYVSSVEYIDRAATALGTRAQTFATVMYNAPQSIKVINVSLPDATCSESLDSTLATLAISERDMLTVLTAAQELVQKNSPQILGALTAAR